MEKDAKIKIVREKEKLGTLGSIINIKSKLKNSFFVLNGDSYFDVNIRDLEFGQTNSKKDIGVALTKIKSPLNKFSYQLKNGKIDKINSQGYIVDLNKKPILDHKGRKIFVPEEYRRYYKEV